LDWKSPVRFGILLGWIQREGVDVRSIIGDLAGGVALIVVASAVGIAQNTVRSNPIPLIQKVAPVSTVQRHDERAAAESTQGAKAAADTAASDTAAAQKKAPLPEGAVDLKEAKRIFDEGMAVILDARSPSAFADGHIPGAINIPYDQLTDYLDTLAEEVPKEQQVMCYCWSSTCDFSDQLATELKFMGYKDVVVFTGGWEEWTAAGYPTLGMEKK
jgi:rhodanese-related sulfurtransferase